jgi:lysine 2-monooxygenase
MPNLDYDRNEIRDIAIIGGGCAGLYCAWRLVKDSRKRVYLFEKDGRLGGRLLSMSLLPESGRKAELGGMRYTDRQLLIGKLIDFVSNQLKVEQPGGDQPSESPLKIKDFSFKTTLMYLRGMRLLEKNGEWARTSLHLPYRALQQAATKTPDGDCPRLGDVTLKLAKGTLKKALDNMTGQSLNKLKNIFETSPGVDIQKQLLTNSEWTKIQEEATINGIHLFDMGFWNLLHHFLEEPDDFLFLHDAIGYESLLANWNAALAITFFLAEFGTETYFTIANGMETLPRMLAFYCRQETDACIIAEHHQVEKVKLVSDEKGEKYFELSVKCTPSHFDNRIAYDCTYRAKQVILALPQEALKQMKVEGFSSGSEQRFRDRLENVTPHPAFKLFLRYDEPWWEDELGAEARATTDLPIRQVYYLGEKSEKNEKGEKVKTKPGLVMASYSDEHYVDFWEPLVKDPAREAQILKQIALGIQSSTHAASQRIIDKAEAQLKIMHGKAIPKADVGVVKEWKQAWHYWNVHVKPWELATEMITPLGSEVGIFLCGEAYSLEQGWVEGALKSAERVLQKVGLDQPAWIDRTAEMYEAVGCANFDEYISS